VERPGVKPHTNYPSFIGHFQVNLSQQFFLHCLRRKPLGIVWFFKGQMFFLSLNQQCQSTKGNTGGVAWSFLYPLLDSLQKECWSLYVGSLLPISMALEANVTKSIYGDHTFTRQCSSVVRTMTNITEKEKNFNHHQRSIDNCQKQFHLQKKTHFLQQCSCFVCQVWRQIQLSLQYLLHITYNTTIFHKLLIKIFLYGKLFKSDFQFQPDNMKSLISVSVSDIKLVYLNIV